MRTISIDDISFANDKPLVVVGGCNVLESRDLAMEVAAHFKDVTEKLGIGYVFKSSFDKANRSSLQSFRGPGMEKGLRILAEIKEKYAVALLTDVHLPQQAEAVAQVADIVQLPAFLSRQTDLVTAIARTGAVINIKKAQFLAPAEMRHIIAKVTQCGNDSILLCERGTCFGYNNLIVDFLGFDTLKSFGYPLLFDITHSLQRPGALSHAAGGRREQITSLARAGVSQKIAGLFLEAHPEPDKAMCDGPSALPLAMLEPFLAQLQKLDNLVKKLPELNTG